MSRTGLLPAVLALASMLTATSSALAHPSTVPPAEESAGPTAFGVLPGLAAAIAEEAPNEDWQAVASAGHPAGAAIGLAVAMPERFRRPRLVESRPTSETPCSAAAERATLLS